MLNNINYIMKKNILFHINSLNAGGAEKSLVSLLNTLPKDKYNIDVLVNRKEGIFVPLIPNYINIIESPFPHGCLMHSPKEFKYYIKHNLIYWIKKIYRIFKAKKELKKYNLQQILWEYWKNDIPCYKKKYDVAISYAEGFSNYAIIDKIYAEKKILWMHSDYLKLNYNAKYDYQYFEKADKIITISSICKDSLIKSFPQIENKFEVIENISNSTLIQKMAKEPITDDIPINKHQYTLVSIGRLVPVKAFDLAINAAKLLKERDLDFVWYIIGDGFLKQKLQDLIIKDGLASNVFLLGLKANPYKYMNLADVIVQSSKYEGKSIAIDEAKILHKPIVSTNYATVYDVIKHNETGLIAEMTEMSLAENIYKLLKDKELQNQIIKNLTTKNWDNCTEINKLIKLIE